MARRPRGVSPVSPESALEVRVLGPDSTALGPRDLKRLFSGRRLSPARCQALLTSPRIVVACRHHVVGMAVYERVDAEIHVHDCGIDRGSPCRLDAVAGELVAALEMACLAAGGRRVVFLPQAVVSPAVLTGRGYRAISKGAGVPWYEKTLSE